MQFPFKDQYNHNRENKCCQTKGNEADMGMEKVQLHNSLLYEHGISSAPIRIKTTK